jgi:UDP-N-acetylmuramate dehydrogenase
MISISKNSSLRPFNTFGLDVNAAHFCIIRSKTDLAQLIRQSPPQPIRILGGGSNIVFVKDVEGTLVKNEIKGKEILQTWSNKVHVKIGGGENWHETVRWAVEHGYGGLENLSLIPGTVGAAPVQNIGAYGVELKDVFVRLTAIDLQTGQSKTFWKKDCSFGYRDSVFKTTLKGRYFITDLVLSLTRHRHAINSSYGDISKTLEAMQVTGTPSIDQISKAVIAIRSSKLPDPKLIGNCGSFFKNPEISSDLYASILQQHPAAPGYPLANGKVKIPAGWLIEQCGWKGKRVGNTGSYEKQALVLVNHGGATGAEVAQLAKDIIQSVKTRFDVDLEAEVNIW